MNVTMLVPVTDKLRDELVAAGVLLDTLDKNTTKVGAAKLNDRAHFTRVVDQLESLVIAALSASSSTPLTRTKSLGASFDMGSRTTLARHVSETVAYLRSNATELLGRGNFSNQTSDNTTYALAFLKTLNGLLLTGIVKQAEADLERVRSLGIGSLLAAAEVLAKGAVGGRWCGDEGEEDTEPWEFV